MRRPAVFCSFLLLGEPVKHTHLSHAFQAAVLGGGGSQWVVSNYHLGAVILFTDSTQAARVWSHGSNGRVVKFYTATGFVKVNSIGSEANIQ